MRRIVMAAVAAAALAVSTLAVPASAASAAYCDPGTGVAGLDGVTGSVRYLPPVLSPTGAVLTQWEFDVTLRCTVGLSPATGTYHLIIKGTSAENCALGGGGGSVQAGSAKTAGVGAGPVANGIWQYTRYGIHYYGYPGNGDGDIWVQETSGLHHYKVYMWLDLVPTVQNGNCPGAGGQIVGHAMITEP